MDGGRGTYIPHTESDVRIMLEAIGMSSVDELFADIPEAIRSSDPLNLPDGLSEYETYSQLASLAAKNVSGVSFLGGGSYDHIVPSVVRHLTSRPEFVTAYTPYQAEISQGILQAIFEFQTLMCQLTGLDAANASLYDGHTAAAEACSMALNASRGRKTLLVSDAVHPYTRQVIETFFSDLDVNITLLSQEKGRTGVGELEQALGPDTAGVLVQTPNMYGVLEDLNGWSDAVHAAGAQFIVSSNPMSLGCCKSPGEWNADIAVADGQPLGLSQFFGGPSVGILTARDKLLRKMPGRIVGETVDAEGTRAFVLTLQAREQHIKRSRATSNICSNQALAALSNAIYLSYLGKRGFQEVSERCTASAHYAYDSLCAIGGVEQVFEYPFFNEFCVRLPTDAQGVVERLVESGFFGGVPLQGPWGGNGTTGNDLMIAVTEKRSKSEIDNFAQALEGAIK